MRAYQAIYHDYKTEVCKIQNKAGRYQKELDGFYLAHWEEIRRILSECPSADAIEKMLTDVGFSLPAFEAMYGKKKVQNSIWFGKDLKDRYSVLWLYFTLFMTSETLEGCI